MNTRIGLYLHIPFCRQRCDFCAFYLEVYRERAAEAFLHGLETEIRLYRASQDVQNRQFQSIYIGGGTPTVLTPDQLTAILTCIRRGLSLHECCETTVEAHPATVTDASLAALREAGVTRISFGAESLNDAELKRIGRPGAADETIAAVGAARKAGFTDINLDLMYGLPQQTLHSWEQTLLGCCALQPTHLSCYALTVEAGTTLAHDIRHGRAQAPDESLQMLMETAAQDILRRSGYQRYEISNYAKPGFECRHNLLYWTQGEYLGLGPSAQSFVGGDRFGNVANLSAYLAALAEGRLPVQDRSTLSDEEQLRDGVIFGLRLLRGVPTSQLRDHAENYGYLTVVDELKARKLIEEEGDRSRLSTQGRWQADTIAEKLF